MIRFRIGLMALAVAVLGLPAEPAHAQFQFGGEKVIKIADLPDVPPYQSDDGVFYDVGAIYKQFSILWLPLHNYEVRWVGYTGNDGRYVMIDEALLRQEAAQAGITLPAEVPIPFWDAWGGKLVFGAIVLLIIGFSVMSARRKRAAAYPPNYPPQYPPHGQPNYPPHGQPNYPPQGQPNYPQQGQPDYPPQNPPNYPPQG